MTSEPTSYVVRIFEPDGTEIVNPCPFYWRQFLWAMGECRTARRINPRLVYMVEAVYGVSPTGYGKTIHPVTLR
jgi:hypothetical protein